MGDRKQYRAYFLMESSSRGIFSGSSARVSTSVPPISYKSSETDVGVSTPKLARRSYYRQGYDNHRGKRRPHSTSSAGSGNHNNNYTPYQGDNGQYTLRKDISGIHTKNTFHTKNIRLTQATQGCSHIKAALQENST